MPQTSPTVLALLIAPAVLVSAPAAGQDAASETAPTPQTTPEPVTDDGLPVVNSKEDYLALPHRDRKRFSRLHRGKVSFFVDGESVWSTSADLDNTTGDVSVARLGAGGGISLWVSDTADLIFRGRAQFSFYDFNNAAGVVPSMPALADPFDDVYDVSFEPVFRDMPEHGWQWFIGGRIRSAGESDANFGDTIIGGGFAGASYDVTPTLRLGAGVNVESRLEGGVWAFPVPLIEWDITEDLTLLTREDGVALEYWFAHAWNVSLIAGYERHQYRLADRNAISGGSVIDQRIPVSLALTYSPSESLVISGRVGAEFGGSLEFDNAGGNEIVNSDLGSNLLFGLNISLGF